MIIKIKNFFLFFLFFFAFVYTKTFAQQLYYPLNTDVTRLLEKNQSYINLAGHLSFKPVLYSIIDSNTYIHQKVYQTGRDSNFLSKRKYTWFWRKLRSESFIQIRDNKLEININPLLYIEKQKLSVNDTNYQINTRGIELYGNFGKKFSFYTDFYENQAYFIPYIDEYVNKRTIVPGQGARKTFKKRGHDYSNASGYISYSPIQNINITFGHGKHFVGDGYRSLFLSDNSYSYPFLKFQFTNKKYQYIAIYSELQGFSGAYYSFHYKKHATFTWLSYKPLKNIEIGFFEGIIWQTSADTSYAKKFPAAFFIPVPVFRPFLLGLNAKNNALAGFNLSLSMLNNFKIYAQYMFDNLKVESLQDNKKTGAQLGIKCYDLFFGKIPKTNFYLQAEINKVNKFTYTHRTERQAFTHLNQPLAFPLDSGCTENVIIAKITSYNFFAEIKMNKAKMNLTTDKTIYNKNVRIGYVINPATRLTVYAGFYEHKVTGTITNSEKFYFFGIQSQLNNYYFDF